MQSLVRLMRIRLSRGLFEKNVYFVWPGYYETALKYKQFLAEI